jgi:hypothetical protein
MDGLMLLRHARLVGLRVTASGDTLVVKGPRRLEPLALTLLAEKPVILRALVEEPDVTWRIEVMRPQAMRTGPLPLLLARPGSRFQAGSCCSCGDPRPADRYRCRPCVAAAVRVLAAVRAPGIPA